MKSFIEGAFLDAIGSHPSRGGWIEIGCPPWGKILFKSHPSRGGWIEIQTAVVSVLDTARVPPLTGWVD